MSGPDAKRSSSFRVYPRLCRRRLVTVSCGAVEVGNGHVRWYTLLSRGKGREA